MSKNLMIIACLALIFSCFTATAEDVLSNSNHEDKMISFIRDDNTCIPPQSSSAIDGFYFLRGYDPGDKLDIGSILKNETDHEEYTSCIQFLVFHFAEPGIYDEIYHISNIYYHIWMRVPLDEPHDSMYDVGYSTDSGHHFEINESVEIDTDDGVSFVGDYSCVTTTQIVNPEIATFQGNDIYNFTVKVRRSFPKMLNSPYQQSFIIINLEENETLETLDRDNDDVSDFDEVYTYFSNPFDPDTDNDGATDYEELFASSYGFESSDPNNYTDTTSYRRPLSIDIESSGYAIVGETISFMGFTSDGIEPYTWSWDFGNGDFSDQQNPVYMYEEAGQYIVTLTVSDVMGKIATMSKQILIFPNNRVQNNNKGTSYGYIQDAINDADEGDIIVADKSTYYESIDIDKTLTLQGSYKDQTFIFGEQADHVVDISANNVNLTGFTISFIGITHFPPPSVAGIYLKGHNADISNNILISNIYGIYCGLDSENNCIYHNNFKNNNYPAYDEGVGNFWYKDLPFGGNYWQEYIGEDDNNDGIIDEPHLISSENNQDMYPLMYEFYLGDMNLDTMVDFQDINPWVLALNNPRGYQQIFSIMPSIHGDINQDGLHDIYDANPFIQLLTKAFH